MTIEYMSNDKLAFAAEHLGVSIVEKQDGYYRFEGGSDETSTVQLTQAELDSIDTSWAEKQESDQLATTAESNTAASGNQKLLDLGLTQAEATALTGYTPPTE